MIVEEGSITNDHNATLQLLPQRVQHREYLGGLPSSHQPNPRVKPKHKLARKQQAIAITLCKELQASNFVYKSQGAPARGIGPPLV